ncbi:MAG: hypothetical protein ACW960_06580 [Candidatus Thorarchaeota archaeon]
MSDSPGGNPRLYLPLLGVLLDPYECHCNVSPHKGHVSVGDCLSPWDFGELLVLLHG